MTILFGTLGYTPEKLLPSFREHSVEKLVVFHDKVQESVDAARDIQAYCQRNYVPCKTISIPAFEMVKTAKTIQAEVRKHPRESIVFNISGGTPVLATAATLVCILEGLRTICLHSKDGRQIDLPLPRIQPTTFLTGPQRRILAAIARAGGKGITQAGLEEHVEVKRSTINHHVKALREKGLIIETPSGREKRLQATETAALLLDEEPK